MASCTLCEDSHLVNCIIIFIHLSPYYLYPEHHLMCGINFNTFDRICLFNTLTAFGCHYPHFEVTLYLNNNLPQDRFIIYHSGQVYKHVISTLRWYSCPQRHLLTVSEKSGVSTHFSVDLKPIVWVNFRSAKKKNVKQNYILVYFVYLQYLCVAFT